MKTKNCILKKLKPLLAAPSFTSKEARLCGVSSSAIAYYVKLERIKRIGHGVYHGLSTSSNIDFRFEGLVEAMQRVKNGVVCLTTALYLYGLTEEMPAQYWIAIRNGTMHRQASSTTRIVRMRNLELGRTLIKLNKIKISVFSRERTIVDAFRYLGRETALKALESSLSKKKRDRIDLEKIRKYAKQLRVNIEPYLIAMTL